MPAAPDIPPASRPLGRGELRLLLLWQLGHAPQHGYELIQRISAMFAHAYTPSAGSVYPLLAAFERQHWVTADADGGRSKRYQLTAAGREQLQRQHEAVQTALLRARHCARTQTKNALPAPIRQAMQQLTDALIQRQGQWQGADTAQIAGLLQQATALLQHHPPGGATP